jgi:hypothetical protein
VPQPPAALLRSLAALRVERADELAVVGVGALVLQTLDRLGQTRLFGRAIDSLLERTTAGLTSEEVMRLEVEAYEILDFLVGPEWVADEDAERIARKEGDLILYDPHASVAELILRAVDERFDVKIDYFSKRRGEMNTRIVTPIRIEAEVYLLAYCHARQSDRVFRMNRITRCVPVHGRASPTLRPAESRGDGDAAPIQMSLLDD